MMSSQQNPFREHLSKYLAQRLLDGDDDAASSHVSVLLHDVGSDAPDDWQIARCRYAVHHLVPLFGGERGARYREFPKTVKLVYEAVVHGFKVTQDASEALAWATVLAQRYPRMNAKVLNEALDKVFDELKHGLSAEKVAMLIVATMQQPWRPERGIDGMGPAEKAFYGAAANEEFMRALVQRMSY